MGHSHIPVMKPESVTISQAATRLSPCTINLVALKRTFHKRHIRADSYMRKNTELQLWNELEENMVVNLKIGSTHLKVKAGL